MRKYIIGIISLLIISFLNVEANTNKAREENKKSTSYTEILGKIVDSKTGNPVVFANVVITGTNIATVSNSDGEFVLKVPDDNKTGTLSFTHLGYQNAVVEISTLNGGENHIKLTAVSMPIEEVIVGSNKALTLIHEALKSIDKNYSSQPEMQVGFYRESIKQNRSYVAVSEAVVDIYKSPYNSYFDSDKIRIYKGRKSRNVKKMDTLVVKLQGGPRTSIQLDLVKNPGDILTPEVFEYYDFEMGGTTSIDNRETYVIKFDQKVGVEYPLYSGYIYIDSKTKAFAGLDFGLSEKGLPYAPDVLVRRKPTNLKIDILSGHYLVRYRIDDDNQWYINYVRSEINMDSKWKRKLFKSTYKLTLEMAVTDRDKNNTVKITSKEAQHFSDIFAEQVSSFEDPDYWGDYNTIKPDESIEDAIKKLNRKLKRN